MSDSKRRLRRRLVHGLGVGLGLGLAAPAIGASDLDEVVQAAKASRMAQGHAVWRIDFLRAGNPKINREDVMARASAIAESQHMSDQQKLAFLDVQSQLIERQSKDLTEHSSADVIWKDDQILAKQRFEELDGKKLETPIVRRSFYTGKDVVQLNDVYDPKTKKPVHIHTLVEPRTESKEHEDLLNSFPDRCVFCGEPVSKLFSGGILPSPRVDGDGYVFSAAYDVKEGRPGLEVRMSKSHRAPEKIDVLDGHGYRFLRYELTWEGDSSLPKRVRKAFLKGDGSEIVSATWKLESLSADDGSFKDLDEVLHPGQPISDARFGSLVSVDYLLRGKHLPTDDQVSKLTNDLKRAKVKQDNASMGNQRNWMIALAVFMLTCIYVIYRRLLPGKSRSSPPTSSQS